MAVIGAWLLRDYPEAEPQVENQVWTERYPTGPKDEVTWLAFIEDGTHRMGVVRRASDYRFTQELFRWSRRNRHFRLEFPQSGRQISLRARAYRCKVGDWELCLDLLGERREVTFYSMKDWQLGHAEVPDLSVPPLAEGCDPCPEGIPSILRPALAD